MQPAMKAKRLIKVRSGTGSSLTECRETPLFKEERQSC